MTKTLKNKLLVVFIALFVALTCAFGVTSSTALAATTDHSLCENDSEYCLVCDVAEKVNAIPNAEDITIDNAAKVMQQINDIDRIKFDLSDDEYDELLELVDTQPNASGNGLHDIAKYVNAVNKIKELTGVKLAISKSLNLGNGVEIADLSEAEVSFEITNVDTNATQTLTLFDLGTQTSAFGADFYTANYNGWTYAYLLPAGTYTIKEINQNKPITVNGNEYLFTCAEVSDGTTTETGADAVDGMTIDLIPGSSASVLISNVRFCPFTEWKNALENDFSISLDSIKEIYVGDTPPDIDNVIRSISFTDATNSNDYGTIYYDNENVVSFVKVNPIVFPSNCSALFSDLPNCHTITINNVDLSMVTTMSSFVANNPNLTNFSVDDSFNTFNVSMFNSFFAGCEKLESVSFDSLGFEFDSLISLDSFFENCTSLESVDASYISKNTAPNLTNMQNMFSGAESLKSIDFSNVVFPSVATDPLQGFLSGVSESLEEMSLSANMASHIDESDLYRDSQGHTKGEWFCEGVNYGHSLDKIAETGKAGTYKIIEEHTYDDNGFCVCGGEHYQAPTVVTYDNYSELGLSTSYIGYYAIRNGGQLYWFSAYVNGFDSGVQHLDANAVLLNDIYVNTNVLSADGSLNSGTFRQWHPISLEKDSSTTYKYVGTFDGYGHTISGLYAKKGNYYVALFGYLANGGVIRRVGVIDSYFNTSYYAASICAKNIGTIENCYSNATVHISHAVAGGITAYNDGGTIKNCYFYGKVTAVYKVGAIDGYGMTSKGVITNCYYLNGCAKDTDGLVHGGIGNANDGVVTADVVGKTEARTAEQFASGEVTSKLNGGVVNGSQAFYQTLSTDAYPSFNGATVYENVTSGCGSTATYAYDNIDNDVYNHTYEGAYVKEGHSMEYQLVCARCDIPATLGVYSDSTLIVYSCLSPITGLYDTNMPNEMRCNKSYMVNEPSSIEGTEPEHSVAYTYSKTSDGVYLDTTDTSKVGYYKPYLVVNGNRYLCDSFYIKPGDTILKNDWKTNYVDCIGEVHIDGTLPVGYTMNDDGSITNGVNVVAPTDVSTGEKLTKAYLYEVDGNIYIVNSAEYSWYVNIKSGNALFSGMSSITALYLDNLDTTVANLGMANVEDFYEFANDCSNLENITFGDKFKLDVATDLRYMLANNKVTLLDLSTWNVAKALENGTGTIANMLYGCNDLQQIILPYDLAVNLSQTGLTFNHVDAFYCDGAYYREVDEFESMVVDENVTYTLTAHTHATFTNGFCDDCGGYQAPEKVDGVYQITNGGNLFWFAEAVNAGEYDANAIITENYIDLASYLGYVFPGIGGRTTNTAYTGYFDGNGATIENLYIENDANISDNVGFVNLAIGATVENFTVKGSIVITKLISNVAGVIGQVGNGTTVTGVNSYVNITTTHGGDNGDTSGTYYAGIIGFVNGNNVVIEKCAYYGTINTGASVCTTGGIAGHAGYNRNTLIKDSAFYGTIINTRAKSIIGGIVAYANTLGNIKIQNCLVVGTFEHNETVDEVDLTAFGTHNSNLSELTNSYYRTNSTILKVVKHEKDEVDYGVTATKVTDEQLASGEVAWLLNGGKETDPVWKQYIGYDEYPSFVGVTVYRYITSGCCKENYTYAYANYEEVDVFSHGEPEFVAETKRVICSDCTNELKAYVGVSQYFVFDNSWRDATAIYINGTLPEGYDEAQFVDVTADGSDIKVYLYQDTDGALYIVNGAFTDAMIYVVDASSWFVECKEATVIDLTYVDFSECESMMNMFWMAGAEKIIFDENINTSACENMYGLFGWTDKLTEIVGLEGFDTENVTTMGNMFFYADSLEMVDISSFDTSKVETMEYMFVSESLKEIIIGDKFSTESLTNISYMFYHMKSIEWSDIEHIIERMDTSKVTNMSGLFASSSIERVDLSTFETNALEISEENPVAQMFDESYKLRIKGATIILPAEIFSMLNDVSGLYGSDYGSYDIDEDGEDDIEVDFNGWEITTDDSDEITYYLDGEYSSVNFNPYVVDGAHTYTLTAHAHTNAGLYYVESDEFEGLSSNIEIYCSCGELYDVITIVGPDDDELEYTGKAIDFEPTYFSQNDKAHESVNFAIYYWVDADGEWIPVDEIKEIGNYKIVMSMGVATRSVDNASSYAEAELEFSVTAPEFYIVFEDYDGRFIYEDWAVLDGTNADEPVLAPDYTVPNNAYYEYTIKHWLLIETGTEYTALPTAQELFDTGYTNFTFRAVYNIKYLKEFHLVGSIDEKTDLSTSGIYASDKNVKIIDDENGEVTVYVNYEIKTNGGITALLLIPEYDSNFTISAVSINGENVLGSGVASTKLLSGWETTVTGENSADTFKILLEYLDANGAVNTSTGELFIQIAYTMESAVTGEYDFGFVTRYANDTYDNSTDSDLSHNDRSEAYGVLTGSPVASFNELKISVDKANIIIVARQEAEITMEGNSVVYDAAAVDVTEDCKALEESIENAILYHYSAYGTTLADDSEWDWLQYVNIKWYSDADGENGIATPTNVGTYYVGISAEENDYFKAIAEQIFEVTITPYTIDVSAEKLNDKTYNGVDQTWTEDDFTITYVDGKQALDSDTGYDLEITDATYKNAGTYTVTLTFTATDNYTFTENGVIANAGDTKEISLDVVMNQFALTITAENKTSQYSVDLAELTYLLSATNSGEDATFASSDSDLTITLTTAATTASDVGAYNITINATSKEDNYIFTFVHEQADNAPTADNGTYTITRKQITAPTIEDLTYNGQEQFPTEEVAYEFTGDSKKDVGNYKLTATLVSNNYVWVDYVNTNNDNKIDRELDWKIVPAALTVTIGTKTDDYGKTEEQALETMLSNATVTGLIDGDSLEDLIVLSFETNGAPYIDASGFVMPDENGYEIAGVESANSGNYTITINNGKYIVNPVALGPQLQEIIANIKSNIKEYTGSEIIWATDDFTFTSTLKNGEEIANVLEITVVAKQDDDYINANGKVDDSDAWTYYDPETKLYYSVTIKVKDGRQGAYSFGSSVDEGIIYEQNVDVEVFIKQATNEWTTQPTVNATDIANVSANSEAEFGSPAEVKYYTTEECMTEIEVADMVAGTTYYAKFVIEEVNNYTGLNEIVSFTLNFGSVTIPVVYLDGDAQEIVAAGGTVEIFYDGLTHKFTTSTGGDATELASVALYTVTLSTPYTDWKNALGTYTATVEINSNYKWSSNTDTANNDTQNALVYTLVIKKASLTITADDKTITYRDAAPAYTTTENAFVNGENYATYKENFAIADYISCTYAQNDNVGPYNIGFTDGAESDLEAILVNYDVTLTNGTLTVEKLALDLSGLKGQLDSEPEQAWADLVATGLTVEYNAATHEVKVIGYPDELVPTITYIQNENSVTPKNAGTYTVTVVFNINVADGYIADNFTWTDPSNVTLEITKVAITVTASAQKTAYTGSAIVASALTADDKTMNWEYTGQKGDDEIGFITTTDAFTLTSLSLNDTYTAVGDYENAIKVLYSFAEGVEDNYIITFADGTLTIEKENLTWTIILETTNRDYNGTAIKEGETKVDYYATLADGADRQYLTYKFYDSNADDAVALNAAPVNAGTYYVKAFYNDTIHNEITTGFVEIVISKATVTIAGVEDITKNYLQDYEVAPTATKPTLDTEDGYVPSVKVEYYSGESLLDGKPLTVGTYTIKVSVSNLTDNYKAEEVVKTLTINKAKLSEVTFTYSLDTATWEAITTSDDGELINKYGNVTVTYKVDETEITNNSFTANAIGVYTLVASVEDNDNFENSESVMEEVFSVTFADSVENHAKNNTVYDFSPVAPVQYRFSGQMATQPPCSNSDAEEITIDGYTFTKGWELGDTKYSFMDTANTVTANIILHALWTIETYTVTWMNDSKEIYKETYEYLEAPVYNTTTYGTPTRTETDEWIYTFSGWGTAIDGSVIEIPAITADATYYAIYTKEGVTYTVTFMLSIDGGEYTVHKTVENAKFGELLTTYCTLDEEVSWFRGDIWYAQEGRWTKVETVPVGGITVYGAYVFDIGNGDVNADGEITADDITLYRQWIVGGYTMTVVESGSEWDLVNTEGFAATLTGDNATKYFIARVADVNTDTSDDIRDITTVRMSIVGGYGYQISEGLEKAKVTGKAVTIDMPELTYEIVPDHESTSIVGKTITLDFEKAEEIDSLLFVHIYAKGYSDIDSINIETEMYCPDGSQMADWEPFYVNPGWWAEEGRVGVELIMGDRAACVNGTYVLRMRIIDNGYAYDWQNYSVVVINNKAKTLTYTVDTESEYRGSVTEVESDTVYVSCDDSDEYVYNGFLMVVGNVRGEEDPEFDDEANAHIPSIYARVLYIKDADGDLVFGRDSDDVNFETSGPFSCTTGTTATEENGYVGVYELQFNITIEDVDVGEHIYYLTFAIHDADGDYEEVTYTIILVKN